MKLSGIYTAAGGNNNRQDPAVRSRGRQRKTWIDNEKEDLEKKNADIEAAMELIGDRQK